jgi:hypothetical protein
LNFNRQIILEHAVKGRDDAGRELTGRRLKNLMNQKFKKTKNS